MYMCHNPRWDPRAPEITEDIYVYVSYSKVGPEGTINHRGCICIYIYIYIYMYMCHNPRWDPRVPARMNIITLMVVHVVGHCQSID